MNLVTSQKMLAAETKAVERGTTFAALMEKAGSESARIIYENYCADKKNVLIISGKGKNGGDGFVIARKLAERGCNTIILLPCGKPADEISLNNLNLLDEGTVYETDDCANFIRYSDIIVDCLFGTGFKGSLDEKCSELAKAVNASGKTVVSIDIPSGAVCDTAETPGETFRADMTIAISALKPIHIMKPACRICGRVEVADIGIAGEDYEGGETSFLTLTDNEVSDLLPFRPAVSN
ncbi:MAG: NAD(P)H-hydrate epimerase, partial [Clostridia bacterium]|nr:NAD(P)H-hydrate epimerase [Clostridia bacterium]